MASGHLQNGMMPVSSSHGMAPQMPGMVPISSTMAPAGDYKMDPMSNAYGEPRLQADSTAKAPNSQCPLLLLLCSLACACGGVMGGTLLADGALCALPLAHGKSSSTLLYILCIATLCTPDVRSESFNQLLV